MALTTCIPVSAKADMIARFLATRTMKMLLIKSGHAGTYDNSTTAVGTPGTGTPSSSNVGTDECPASGTYAAGGFTMAGGAPGSSGSTAWQDWTTDPNWTGATLSAVGAIIYDDTTSGKPVLSLHDFGGVVSSTAGTFTVTLPAAAAATAVVRLA